MSYVYGLDNSGNAFSCIKIFKLDIVSCKWLQFKNNIYTNRSKIYYKIIILTK